MNVKEEIRSVMASRGKNIKSMEIELGFGLNSLRSKIDRETIRYTLIKRIAEKLNKRIVWEDIK